MWKTKRTISVIDTQKEILKCKYVLDLLCLNMEYAVDRKWVVWFVGEQGKLSYKESSVSYFRRHVSSTTRAHKLLKRMTWTRNH